MQSRELKPDLTPAYRDPARHCFRENCTIECQHDDKLCHSCGFTAEEHTGCDCEPMP